MSQRFAFSYNRWMRLLAGVLGLGPRWSRVDVDATRVRVAMGWAFRAELPRSAIVEAHAHTERVWAWGAHGWRGRWLVNGSSAGLVTLRIHPRQRGWAMGVPLRLRELTVSVEDPDGFLAALRADR